MHLAIPLSFPDLLSYGALTSTDGRLVRAGLAMLYAAWAASTQGRLPPGVEALSAITALAPEQVQEHYEVLTNGWVLRDGSLCCPQLESQAERLNDRFGAELEVLRASWMAAVQPGQAPDGFELVPPEAVARSRARGKRMLPSDFSMDATTMRHVTSAGYDTEDLRQWLVQRFQDYARARGQMQRDWQASLRNFALSAITLREFREFHGYALGRRLDIVHGSAQSQTAAERLRQMSARQPETFGQRTRQANSQAMADALERGLASLHPTPGG